jgi:hypothetical protein
MLTVYIRVAENVSKYFWHTHFEVPVFGKVNDTQEQKCRGYLVRKKTIPTGRPLLSAKLVSTLADRGCCVVSVTDPYDSYTRFSRLKPLIFLPCSSSIIRMRLSGPYSRTATSQKSGNAGNRTRNLCIRNQEL